MSSRIGFALALAVIAGALSLWFSSDASERSSHSPREIERENDSIAPSESSDGLLKRSTSSTTRDAAEQNDASSDASTDPAGPRPAILRGRLLDFRREPIRKHWTVTLRPNDPALDAALVREVRAPIDSGGSETFELIGISPGKWIATASYPTFGIGSQAVELSAGDTREIELVQSGSRDPWREILVNVDVGPARMWPESEDVRLHRSDGTVQSAEGPWSHRGGASYGFRGLEAGLYRIAIEDVAYEPWSLEGVEPSPRPVIAELRGRSGVELQVLDGLTRAPLESYACELISVARKGRNEATRFGGVAFADGHRFRFLHHPGGKKRIEGLVTGDLRFRIVAPDWPDHYVDVPELLPGEVRRVTLELFRGVTVEGEVRSLADGVPVAGALVALFAQAQVDDGSASPFGPASHHIGAERTSRREIARAESDATGKFRLEEIPPGEWILTATRAKPGTDAKPMDPSAATVIHEGVRTEATSGPPPIVLELPIAASLSGRVRLADSVSANQIGLRLDRAIEAPNASEPTVEDFERGPFRWLPTGGEYRFDDLVPGLYRLSVVLPYATTPDLEEREPTEGSALAKLRLAWGEIAQRDFDLRSIEPARIEVQLAVEGGAVQGRLYLVHLRPDGTRDDDVGQQASGFDAQGRAAHLAVQPGRKLVYAWAGRWIYVFERELEVLPGAHHVLRGEVQLIEGVIEVVQENDAPLVKTSLQIEHLLGGDAPISKQPGGFRLDAASRVQLALPAGRYRIETIPQSGSDKTYSAEMVWPAGALAQIRLAIAR